MGLKKIVKKQGKELVNMSLINLIIDFIVFFREIIVIAIVAYIWFRIRGERSNEDTYYYEDEDEDVYYHNHLTDEPFYQNQSTQSEQRQYNSPGDFLVNGSLSDFDHTNIHHREAANSFNSYRH